MKKVSALSMILAMAVPCTAGIITVDPNGSADFTTIQAAINDANDGDMVLVADGTYTGEGNRDIDFLGKAITVKSANGPENCIIDCGGAWQVSHRGFYFHQNEGADSILQGFTIRNGAICFDEDLGPEYYDFPPYDPWEKRADHPIGGGIYCELASPTITNCVISNCGTELGGGIGCVGGAPVIINCIIDDCGAGGYGWAESGGEGGGIGIMRSCHATITNCKLTNNTGYFNSCGGGIYCIDSEAEISGCTISNSSSSFMLGGGVYCGPLSFINLQNCTISQNTAEDGGGIFCETDSDVVVTNCILWGDTPDEVSGGDPCVPSDPYVTYTDIQGGWTGGGIGNINSDPFFADPDNDDYHLKSQPGRWDPNSESWVLDDVTSPCIDTGNPGCPLRDEPNGLNNVRINMGAYGGTAEASMTPAGWGLLADLTNDGIVDLSDLIAFVHYWLDSGECIPSDLNRSEFVDSADYAVFADGWLESKSTGKSNKPALAKYYVPYDDPITPDAPGYTLPLDLWTVANYGYMDLLFDLAGSESVLTQNGFAIIEYDFDVPEDDGDDIVTPYEYLTNMDVPLFITADTLLHLYHIQFDETLKDIEEREFYGDICDLTAALLDKALIMYQEYAGDLQEAALRNAAYLAVAQQLIDPEAGVPEFVADVVAGELAKIDAHEGFAPSDIFIYHEDYSQYVPRGHYTRSEELQKYFRALMWYGRMAFLLKGAENWGPTGDALISVYDAKIQTMQAVLLATSIEQVQVGERTGREVWERLYAVTSFYVGLADDLTPYEYLDAVNKLFGSNFEPAELADEDNFFALKVELALLRSPEIFGGTGNVYVTPPVTPESLDEVLDKTRGMRFMGQRFIPDSYMFQHLVFPEVLDYTGDADPVPFTFGWTGASWARCYPRGLDVMAVLGSGRAETILAAEGDTDYVDYALRFGELKDKFDAFDISDWNRNLYWGWLYSLRALIDELPEGYPNFMRTEAWEKKELNAALASWTELRHDTILYAKQSYTPGFTSVPGVTGYVEPVPEFYGRLLALTGMTRQGLSDLDALSVEAMQRLVNLEDILSRLIEIVHKELLNQELSDDDYAYIMGFGEILEAAVLGVDEEGVKTTLVADVHTHGVEQQVVEEGVGYVDLIIVACSVPDGGIFLAAGPVMSYYEFKHPMNDRLTDEAWRQLLDSPDRPDRPTWFQPLVH